MARKYYTLLTRDWKGDAWAIDFGSYVRSEVVAEKADHKEHGRPNWSLLIIVTGDTQQEIAAEVVRLNTNGIQKDDILNSRNVE